MRIIIFREMRNSFISSIRRKEMLPPPFPNITRAQFDTMSKDQRDDILRASCENILAAHNNTLDTDQIECSTCHADISFDLVVHSKRDGRILCCDCEDLEAGRPRRGSMLRLVVDFVRIFCCRWCCRNKT